MNSLYRLSAAATLCFASFLAACSSGGTAPSTSNPVISAPPAAKAKFAYTGNQGASVSGYSVDSSTGALTPLNGFPLSLGVNPTALTHDPQNRFLIVADISSDQLHVLTINSTTGALTEVSSSPYSTIREPVALAFDPTGTHLYVAAMAGNQVAGYSLSSTGVLTAINESPFASGGSTQFGSSVVINAAGSFAYSQDQSNVYAFSISPATGSLTLLQTISGPYQGGALALDPAGTYLYAVGSGTNSILAYSVNPTTGLLTAAKPSAMAEQDGAYTITVSATGQFAYLIEKNNYLVSYVLSNGAFTPVGTPYSGVYGEKIAVDPSGGYAYVPQACSSCPNGLYNVVNEFSAGSSGALTKLSASPVTAGVTPWGITLISP